MLVSTLCGNRPLGRPRYRPGDNINICLQELGDLVGGTFAMIAMSLCYPNIGNVQRRQCTVPRS